VKKVDANRPRRDISTFSEKGELADERFLGKYCESPACDQNV
jgi:hypothetical protein